MKEKNNLPTRSDPIYGEIERFEDYEYTNCIAYEMAIRNDEVKTLLLNGRDKSKDLINYLRNDFLICSSEKDLRNDFLICSSEVDIYNWFKSKKIDNENYKSFFLKKTKEKNFGRVSDYSVETGEGFYVEYSTHLLSGNKTRKNQSISKNYSRPEMKQNYRTNFQFDLNLALPKDELIAYITKIKDEYDKDNSIIKSPLELIGEDLDSADENMLIHKGTGKYNKHRVADMFFIYDGMKKGMKRAQIINEINYYYYDKDNKNTNFTYDTFKNYYEKAIELIDNLKYKELITGVKITN
jgi:hypothetical protein